MLKTVTRRIFSSCPQCEPSVDKNVIIPRKSFSLFLSLSSIENGLDFSPHPVRHSPLRSRENVNFRARQQRQQQQQQPVRNKRAKNRSITRRVRNNLSATASVCLCCSSYLLYRIYIYTLLYILVFLLVSGRFIEFRRSLGFHGLVTFSLTQQDFIHSFFFFFLFFPCAFGSPSYIETHTHA